MIKIWIETFFGRLTARQVQLGGSLFGHLLYLVLADRRRIAWRNLRFVHPHWSTERVHRFARRVFSNFGVILIETVQKQGVPVNFMGFRASATPAAAMLALRSKSPVIPVICTRRPDGRLTLRVAPPVSIRRTSDMRDDLINNTQQMTTIIEQAVRQYPDQWYWMQKRWKKYYPDLYLDYSTARANRKIKKRLKNRNGKATAKAA